MTKFQSFIHHWYDVYGRHDLPWRQSYDPYEVLVSELMLQQTQVERVIPKFNSFLEKFPSVSALAQASLRDVLIAWQGLGYNRRAKYLRLTAKAVYTHDGKFPQNYDELLELPGIGPYTANAICAFAYNQPVSVIETNIRTVFLYHFFPQQKDVSDTELLPLIEKTLLKNNARLWYSALMDYGAYIKKILPNPSRQSKHYTKQSTFKGSIRQTRGEILKILAKHQTISKERLLALLQTNQKNHEKAFNQLLSEELILEDSGTITLAE